MTEAKSKRRYGPMPRPDDQQRRNRISIFLTDAEYALLKEKAGDYDLPIFVRTRAINGEFAPRAETLPKLNFEAWKKLARVANNLNQIAKALNSGADDLASEAQKELAAFRLALLNGGLRPAASSEDAGV